MTEKYFDVLVTEAGDIGGSHKYEGNMYYLTEAEAQQVVAEGKGIIAQSSALETHKSTMDTLTTQLQAKLKEIGENPRLSDLARREDKEAAILESEGIAQVVQERYESELQTLNKAAREKFIKSVPETTLSADEVRTHARLIMSETILAASFEGAMSVLRDQIEHAEPSVLRELQSHFYQIKADLESRMSNSDDRYKRIKQAGDLTKIYESLKKKSMTPEQTELKKRADMFAALAQQRGDVRTEFNRTTKIMRRSL